MNDDWTGSVKKWIVLGISCEIAKLEFQEDIKKIGFTWEHEETKGYNRGDKQKR